ncbi:cyclin [Thraustotheca clavata]|uniref:Cyclin n=1 Tax=Thraustotheca clavata TaxID=74557 RepID=A0A1W0ABP2_9STRA|nr:cyclin [Thraustotheca clavata]
MVCKLDLGRGAYEADSIDVEELGSFSSICMWVFTEKELLDSPSRRDGMAPAHVELYRIRCCEFIEKLGAIFRLPLLVVASGKVFFHRFFALQSYKMYDAWLIAATCLFLAAKVEEHYMKVVDYTKHYLAHRKRLSQDPKINSAIRPSMPTSPTIEAETEMILFTECIVLHVLAYDLNIVHPYTFVANYVTAALNSISANTEANTKTIKKAAWSFINDSSKSTVCLRFEPQVITAAAVYLAGCYEDMWPTNLNTTTETKWSSIFNIAHDALQASVALILTTYSRVEYHKNRPLAPGIQTLLLHHDIPKSTM